MIHKDKSVKPHSFEIFKLTRTFGAGLRMLNMLKIMGYAVFESHKGRTLGFEVKQIVKQKSAKVIVNYFHIFYEIWVKCLKAFLPIYEDLDVPLPIK